MAVNLKTDSPALVSLSQYALFRCSRESSDEIVSYNVLKSLQLPQDTCRESLRQALNLLLIRHDALRTVIRWDLHLKKFILDVLSPEAACSSRLLLERSLEARENFDDFLDALSRPVCKITDELPLSLVLVDFSSSDTLILVFNFLSTAYDYVSWGIILHDLSFFYGSCIRTQTVPELPKLEASYFDFSIWQRLQISEEFNNDATHEYWAGILEGYRPFEFPTDFLLSSLSSYGSKNFKTNIVTKDTINLHTYATEQGSSVSSIFVAAYVILLSAYSNHKDIMVGVAFENRIASQFNQLVGRLEILMPLRVQFSSQDLIGMFLKAVHSQMNQYSNQTYPVEELPWFCGVDKSCNHESIFNYSFSYRTANKFEDESSTDGQLSDAWPIELIGAPNHLQPTTAIDFEISVMQFDTETTVEFSAPSGTLSIQSIKRFSESYKLILSQLALSLAISDLRIQDLKLTEDTLLCLPPSSQEPHERSIATLFNQQVLRSPQSTAVVCGESSHTFEELHIQSNRMANYLLRIGVCRGQYFAIILDVCIDMVVTALASWKIGAPYVPIYIRETPVARLESIFHDASIKFAVTQSDFAPAISVHSQVTAIIIDNDAVRSQIALSDSMVDISNIHGDDIAYCNFTSGTTGMPKGVIVPQKGVVQFAESFRSIYFDRPSEHCVNQSVLMLSKFVTDFSIEQIALGFLSGNKLVMLPKDLVDDEKRLYPYLNSQQVTYISGPPLLLNRLDFSRLTHIRTLLTCGEKFQRNLFDKMRKSFQGTIYNAYGVTETTIYSVVKRFDLNDDYSSCVGYAEAGQKLYITSSDLQLLPAGALGELCISGIGVTLGYINRADQTRKCFLVNPFVDADKYPNHARIYRTGDLARFLPDGSLEFRGRIDDRVKMRGFRVEPEEVRVSMLSFPGIVECAVIAKSRSQDVLGSADFLVAYYTSSADTPFSKDAVVSFLSNRLTPEFIPDKFIHVLGKLPTGPSGKLDVRCLPEISE